MKTYAFETDLAGRYGCCERTVEDKTKVYTKLFASFKSSKIRFDGFKQGYVYQLVVDDSDSPCEEFRCDPSARWYSHKSNSAGLKYEYAIHLWESRCVSMRGPFPCGVNDLTIFKGGDSKNRKERDPDALYFKMEGKSIMNR